ncbi:unnamed protein product [Diatraea saccharalis]|uniref:Uncharacterized protein n=1 Tax=Diatraea saccharalis TaxID=40085 RepID=A0A9N9R500_9NEOP|nr:unnamed protein product [Diatraea saccharalis]
MEILKPAALGLLGGAPLRALILPCGPAGLTYTTGRSTDRADRLVAEAADPPLENEFSSDDSVIDPNYNQDTKNISASDYDEYEIISNKRKFAKNDLQSKRSKYENDVQLARKTSYQQKKVSPMIIYDIPSNEKTTPFLRNRSLSNSSSSGSSSSGSSSSGSSSSGTSSSVSTSSGSSRSCSPNTRPLADNQTTDTQISDKPLVPSLSYLCRKKVSASKTSSGSETNTNSYNSSSQNELPAAIKAVCETHVTNPQMNEFFSVESEILPAHLQQDIAEVSTSHLHRQNEVLREVENASQSTDPNRKSRKKKRTPATGEQIKQNS